MNFHGGDIYNFNKDMLDFSSNINPLGIPESFQKMLVENINQFTQYPDIQYVDLRKSIAKYLNIDSSDYVIPGNGAVEIIYKAVASLNVKEVIIAAPAFSEYRRAAHINGIEFKEIKTYENSTFMLENFLANIKSNSLYVICNPNNPTGTVIHREVIEIIASILKEVNSYLLLDEAFIEFCEAYPECSFVSRLVEFPNVIVIRAATKFFGIPGIRLGYGVSYNKEIIEKIRGRLEPWNINTAAVLAGLSIFEDKKYIEKSRDWINGERPWLYNNLKNINGLKVYPSSANFFLLKIHKDNVDAQILKDLLIDKGILIRTSEGFTHLSSFHIRVAVKDRESNEMLIDALRACI